MQSNKGVHADIMMTHVFIHSFVHRLRFTIFLVNVSFSSFCSGPRDANKFV